MNTKSIHFFQKFLLPLPSLFQTPGYATGDDDLQAVSHCRTVIECMKLEHKTLYVPRLSCYKTAINHWAMFMLMGSHTIYDSGHPNVECRQVFCFFVCLFFLLFFAFFFLSQNKEILGVSWGIGTNNPSYPWNWLFVVKDIWLFCVDLPVNIDVSFWNQPINQSVNQSISQSINQSIKNIYLNTINILCSIKIFVYATYLLMWSYIDWEYICHTITTKQYTITNFTHNVESEFFCRYSITSCRQWLKRQSGTKRVKTSL